MEKTMSATKMKWIKAAIICFYVLLIVGLVLYDEKPSPELARDMAQPRPEITEPGNAWIAFLGFDAPKGVSPYVCGEEKMRKYRDALLAGKSLEELSRLGGGDKPGLPFKGKIPSFYRMNEGGMLAFAAAHPDDVAALSRNNEELLRRYEGLGKYPRHNENQGYASATTPWYDLIKKACQVKLLQLAGKAVQGDVEAALAGVREDAEFWRSIARNSTTFLSKVVALAVHINHLLLTVELGASRQLNSKELAMVWDILRPFDKDEIGFALAIRREILYGQEYLRLVRREAKPWDLVTTLLYKPNATGNRLYGEWQECGVLREAEMSPQQFALEMNKGGDDREGSRRISIPFLYNPVGEIVSVMQSRYFKYYFTYIATGHNHEGFRRLSWLAALSRTENIPPDEMQHFLDLHKTELGNPYTGGAMTWNPKRRSISFTTLDGQQGREIFLQSKTGQ
jgi:hypothetical protein